MKCSISLNAMATRQAPPLLSYFNDAGASGLYAPGPYQPGEVRGGHQDLETLCRRRHHARHYPGKSYLGSTHLRVLLLRGVF